MEFLRNAWNKPIIASIILFVAIFILLSITLILSGGDPQPGDHYFHFKYAYLLRTEGWDVVENFRWIYLLNDHDGVHRYGVSLFQIALLPFTYISDHINGIHVVDAFFVSCVIAVFYYIMRREKVRHALFFSLLLLGSTFFMTRFLLGRAFVLMVGFAYLEMYFAIRKKYIPLFIVVALHVLWHQATYFMPIIIIFFVELSRYIVDKKIALKNIGVTVLGIVVGMAFFPGFPRSLFGMMKQILLIQNSTTSNSSGTMGGTEMLATDVSGGDMNAGIAGMCLFFCIAAVGYIFYLYKEEEPAVRNVITKERMHWLIFLSAFVTFIVCVSFLVTGRFFDFMFIGFVLLIGLTFTSLFETNIINAEVFGGKYFKIIAVIPLIFLCVYSISHTYKRARSFDFTPAQTAANWIDEHSEDGEKVFLHNWSFFVSLFFANSNNTYSMGLEPTSLKSYDEDLYWKYYNIFKNKYYCEEHHDCKEQLYEEVMVKRTDAASRNAFKKENSENVINSIKNDFGAKIVFSESNEFSGMLLLSEELIEDHYAVDFSQSNGSVMRFSVFKLK